jgi:hypothetical protein
MTWGTLGHVECAVKDQDGTLLAKAACTCIRLKKK